MVGKVRFEIVSFEAHWPTDLTDHCLVACFAGGTYAISSSDTFRKWGDGTVLATGQLLNGTEDQDWLCLPDGCYEVEVTSGAAPAEMSFALEARSKQDMNQYSPTAMPTKEGADLMLVDVSALAGSVATASSTWDGTGWWQMDDAGCNFDGTAFAAFDGNTDVCWDGCCDDYPTQWLQLDVGQGNALKLEEYTITSMSGECPTAWTLSGSNDLNTSSFATLDEVSGINAFFSDRCDDGLERVFTIGGARTNTAFRYFRWTFLAGDGGNSNGFRLREIGLYTLANNISSRRQLLTPNAERYSAMLGIVEEHIAVSLDGIDFSSLSTAPPSLDWELALNVDTSDGNVLAYYNWDFWQYGNALGGASSEPTVALTGDFKDLHVFNSTPVRQLLIVVHEEGGALGWRGWTINSDYSGLPMVDFFSKGANVCRDLSSSTTSPYTHNQL